MTDHSTKLDEGALRALVPRVLAGLLRSGEDFYAAEDALQEALLEALSAWPEHPPDDPGAWLATVATRRLVDARRSEAARHRREEVASAGPSVPSAEEGDDTLFLLFCCCNPDLTPASQVALTLRAVGGLTTREIADAFYVPEATMAQRISRATDEPKARGLPALMLLNHARLPARLDSDGRIVTLDRQDRGLWDAREIAEGMRVLQSALAVERRGRYKVEAAVAAGMRSGDTCTSSMATCRPPARPMPMRLASRRMSPNVTTSFAPLPTHERAPGRLKRYPAVRPVDPLEVVLCGLPLEQGPPLLTCSRDGWRPRPPTARPSS